MNGTRECRRTFAMWTLCAALCAVALAWGHQAACAQEDPSPDMAQAARPEPSDPPAPPAPPDRPESCHEKYSHPAGRPGEPPQRPREGEREFGPPPSPPRMGEWGFGPPPVPPRGGGRSFAWGGPGFDSPDGPGAPDMPGPYRNRPTEPPEAREEFREQRGPWGRPGLPPGWGEPQEERFGGPEDRPEPPQPPDRDALFKQLDANDDGVISRDEFRALPPPPRPPRPQEAWSDRRDRGPRAMERGAGPEGPPPPARGPRGE